MRRPELRERERSVEMEKSPWKTCIIRGVILLAYSLLGAFAFMKIERKEERNDVFAQRLLRGLRDDFGAKINLTEGQFQDFVKRSADVMAMKKKKDWTFLYSCEYVMTALTTIGGCPSFFTEYAAINTMLKIAIGTANYCNINEMSQI